MLPDPPWVSLNAVRRFAVPQWCISARVANFKRYHKAAWHRNPRQSAKFARALESRRKLCVLEAATFRSGTLQGDDSMMLDWNGYQKAIGGRLGELAKLSPDTVKSYMTLSAANAQATHLGEKTRQLI